jgi:hypothetical protein
LTSYLVVTAVAMLLWTVRGALDTADAENAENAENAATTPPTVEAAATSIERDR